jgi:predicted component of type VI protein secretion system
MSKMILAFALCVVMCGCALACQPASQMKIRERTFSSRLEIKREVSLPVVTAEKVGTTKKVERTRTHSWFWQR